MTDEAPKPAAHARRVIEQEAETLDADTLRALRLARDRALDEGASGTHRWPIWAGAVAAGVVAVMLLMPALDDGLPGGPGAGAESVIADLDVLAQEDDLGLIEDLEFLAWLSAQEEDVT